MAKIPTRAELDYYLQTHDLSTANPCTLKENRFKTPNPEEPGSELYCWRGIIHTHKDGKPDCVIGSVCDPYSFTNARTRFCLTWGCDPHLYVANEGTADAGVTVINERGGTVVYTPKKECEGAFVNKFSCIMKGFRQSLDFALDPANKKQLLVRMSMAFALLIVLLIVWRVSSKQYPRQYHSFQRLTGNVRFKGVKRKR